MIRKPRLLSLVLPFGLLLGAGAALAAEEYGTPEEAKAMLERAVQAVKEDKEQALQQFTAGGEGFKEKDLYVYCGGPEGQFTLL